MHPAPILSVNDIRLIHMIRYVRVMFEKGCMLASPWETGKVPRLQYICRKAICLAVKGSFDHRPKIPLAQCALTKNDGFTAHLYDSRTTEGPGRHVPSRFRPTLPLPRPAYLTS